MLQSIKLSLEAILPIMCYVTIGWLTRKFKVLNEGSSGGFHRFIFYVALPMLQFKNVYECNLAASFDLELLLFMVVATIITMLALIILVPRFVTSNERTGIISQAILRGNAIAFGMPVVLMLCSEAAAGKVAITYSLMFPVINIGSIVVLQWFKTERKNYGEFIKKTLCNPMLIGAGIGAVCNALKVDIPYAISAPVYSIGAMGAPIAFLMLGASLNEFSGTENLKTISAVLLVKLVLIPMVWLTIGYKLLGISGDALFALLGYFATPCAVSSIATARAMGYSDIIMEEMVAYSTLTACITIAVWIVSLTVLGVV